MNTVTQVRQNLPAQSDPDLIQVLESSFYPGASAASNHDVGRNREVARVE